MGACRLSARSSRMAHPSRSDGWGHPDVRRESVAEHSRAPRGAPSKRRHGSRRRWRLRRRPNAHPDRSKVRSRQSPLASAATGGTARFALAARFVCETARFALAARFVCETGRLRSRLGSIDNRQSRVRSLPVGGFGGDETSASGGVRAIAHVLAGADGTRRCRVKSFHSRKTQSPGLRTAMRSRLAATSSADDANDGTMTTTTSGSPLGFRGTWTPAASSHRHARAS